MIARDVMPLADHENAAVKRAVQLVLYHFDVLRPHPWIAVIEDNALVAVGIFVRAGPVDAGIAAHLAIMKAVEVDALSVYFFEMVAGIGAAFGVAGGVDRHRGSAVLDVHLLERVADRGAGIFVHQNSSSVTYLNSVAADAVKTVRRDATVGVPRRCAQGVRPDAVAAHVAQVATRYCKIARPFFQEDTARRIIAPGYGARARVLDARAFNPDLPGTAH